MLKINTVIAYEILLPAWSGATKQEINLRIQGVQGSRIQVKGMEVEPSNP